MPHTPTWGPIANIRYPDRANLLHVSIKTPNRQGIIIRPAILSGPGDIITPTRGDPHRARVERGFLAQLAKHSSICPRTDLAQRP